MDTSKLLADCHRQIEIAGAEAQVLLHVPGKWGKSNRRRLSGTGSPVGTIITDTIDPNRLLVAFRAKDVVDYLSAALK